MDKEKELTVLIELYKIFRDCMERSKKNVLDTYRIYIPALFGFLIAISKIDVTSQALKGLGIHYIIPAVGFFIIVSYAQVVYDLTDVICLGAYLRFLELNINNIIKIYNSIDVAFWEEKFGEALKMANPKNIHEKLLRYTYIALGPSIIMGVWIAVIVCILGKTWISLAYASIFCLIIGVLTYIIGLRRLRDAEKFIKKFVDKK